MDDTQQTPEAPEVSVLIVSRNCAESLRRCLRALEVSSIRQAMEILVVDNGSQDGGARLDSEFPSATFLRLPRNFGLTKARNIGVRTAKGKYLLLLDPRVEVEPGTVAALAGRLGDDTTTGGVSPLLVSPEGEPALRIRSLPKPEAVYPRWSEGGNRGEIANPEEESAVEDLDCRALLVRRQFVKGMNYFDERYGEFGSDPELCFQIRGAAKKILVTPSAKAVFHTAEQPSDIESTEARALLSADHALGWAAYLSKHYGGMAGFRFRLKAILGTLAAVLTFRDGGYHFSLLRALIGGQKIDGSQQGI